MKLIIRENIDDLINVHEIIECSKYVDDSGFTETQTVEDNMVKDTSTYAVMDNYRGYATNNNSNTIKDYLYDFVDGVDYLFKVTRTNVNDSSDVYEFEFWASQLFAEDYAKLSPED